MIPIMLGRLMIGPLLKMAGGLTKSATGLAEGAAQTAVTEKEMVLQNIKATTDTSESGDKSGAGDVSNMSNKDKDKAAKEMFGGLDLAEIRSSIDSSPGTLEVTPEDEGKPATVYKVMTGVLKGMAISLLEISKTLKMLLAIEFQRIQGMAVQERDDNLEESNVEPAKTKKRGLLGKAADGVGGALGGAYSSLKGGLSGNLGKMIGLGALIFAFKNYREEITSVMESVLKGLKAAYDYFTAEDFTFDKFQKDFGNVFWPKIKEIALSFMSMLWTVVKEAIFGPSGDKLIAQQSNIAQESRADLTNDATKSGAIMAKLQKKQASGEISGSLNFGMDETGLAQIDSGLDQEEYFLLLAEVENQLVAMAKITSESDGRIGWSGMPTTFGPGEIRSAARAGLPLSIIANANPVIDGIPYPDWSILQGINLNELGGITRTMSEGRKTEIREKLAERTQAYQAFNDAKLKLDKADPKTRTIDFGKISETYATDEEYQNEISQLQQRKSDAYTAIAALDLELDNMGRVEVMSPAGISQTTSGTASSAMATLKSVLVEKGTMPGPQEFNATNYMNKNINTSSVAVDASETLVMGLSSVDNHYAAQNSKAQTIAEITN